jgi:hypothetical protein
MPKAGTHLLKGLLNLLPGMKFYSHINIGPDQAILDFNSREQSKAERFLRKISTGAFATAHCFYYDGLAELLNEYKIKCITIIRDPRDVCVSDYHYIMKAEDHRLHRFYKKMGSDDERLMASIVGMSSELLDGDPPSLDIGQHYVNYIGWAQYSNGLCIKFEDLIGDKGGGSNDKQKGVIKKIVSYLGIDIGDVELGNIRGSLFSTKATTFRKGQIGSWRDEFKKEHIMAFDKVAGNILDIFGYER